MGFKDFTRAVRDARRMRPTFQGQPSQPIWLRGRNGIDELTRATFAVAFVFALLGLVPKLGLFVYLALVLLGVVYWRVLSKNTSKRYQENVRFLALTRRARRWWPNLKSTLADRRINHYYRCPSCKKRMRVPRGKGTVKVKCPSCAAEFIKKA